MDKQSKLNIELLTKEIKQIDNGNKTHKEVARELIKLGYRKIPEGAVVITAEQNEKWLDYLELNMNKERKETAEKFAMLVEFHSVSTRDENGHELFSISALCLKEILHEEFGISYDEIYKGIAEGKV